MKSFDPLRISTPLSDLSAWLDDMSDMCPNQLMVVVLEDRHVLKQAISAFAKRARAVMVSPRPKQTDLQFMRSILRQKQVQPRHLGRDVREQLLAHPGSVVIHDADRLERDQLVCLAALADELAGPFVVASTNPQLTAKILKRDDTGNWLEAHAVFFTPNEVD